MPKSTNQKLKLLYLLRLLEARSDQQHPLSIADIQTELGRHGISAGRKSLYDDMEALRQAGEDVVHIRGGYYLGARRFELAELKLLVDSVQASRFITRKKSAELIGKIEGLASAWDAVQLHRQVYVADRVKTMNESIYYNVDALHAAITGNRQISFRYFDYAVSRERVYRRDGARYRVSPCALTWSDENYYLVAYDGEADSLKHYRVDKMTDIRLEDAPRQGLDRFAAADMAVYARKVFGMFHGEERLLTLRFRDHLAGAVIDRFGRDVVLVPGGDGSFTFTAPVSVSPQFYGWLCGFGSEAAILAPAGAAADFQAYVRGIVEQYQ